MKYLLFTILFLLAIFINDKKLSAMTDYEIIKICKNERKKRNCIANLKERNINLLKGKRIKIPVIKYKR